MSEIYYDRNRIIQKPTTYRSNQFQDFNTYEPGTLSPTAFDNPPFLWPKKQYMDITGNTHTVQRGYMRSLITDPAYNPGSAVPNRRLFFQFNPQVLVRSVQQSVGAMNPLLQDPAQLVQPVPGTTTFGFELLFNREHEVAAGANTGDAEGAIRLPNGTAGLVSQIGVLADILVLDTITGQGISQDMVRLLYEQSRQQTEKYLDSAEEYLPDSEDDKTVQKQIEATRSNLNSLEEAFNANIGNQAFLNPLPFRVLFSSLFMVEGVATSVDVQFQKFSRTMVPTQCKVTINMYALYFGFARKDTFLTNNLAKSADIRKKEEQEKTTQQGLLDVGIQRIENQLKFNWGRSDAYGLLGRFKFTLSDVFNQALADQSIKDVRVKATLKYKFQASSTSTVSSSSELTGSSDFCDVVDVSGISQTTDVIEIPLEKFINTFTGRQTVNQGGSGKNLSNPGLVRAMKQQVDSISPNEYISYRVDVVFLARIGTADVESGTFTFPIVEGVQWYNTGGATTEVSGPPQTFTNPRGNPDTKARGNQTRQS